MSKIRIIKDGKEFDYYSFILCSNVAIYFDKIKVIINFHLLDEKGHKYLAYNREPAIGQESYYLSEGCSLEKTEQGYDFIIHKNILR
jgi:hypothetical protein